MIDIFDARVHIKEEETELFNILENENFVIDGLIRENGLFRRIPEEVARSVSESVYGLHAATTGGRVRFKTDSKFIALRVQTGVVKYDANTTVSACAGFDIYERTSGGQKFVKIVMAPFNFDETYDGIVRPPSAGVMTEYVINFPVTSEVRNLYIGIEKGAKLEKPESYKYEKPIVFYGSSITMGKCCSRPGSTYENILSRRLDFNYINLGFGGCARGEKEIVEHVAGLDMSVFVLDYDHNANSVEHLRETHEPFYKAVREAHPDIPIIMMSRPKYYLSDEEKARRGVVEETYLNAVRNGDKNVYYIPGNTLMDDTIKDGGTVDGTHPTDAGFLSMANVIEPVLKKALESI